MLENKQLFDVSGEDGKESSINQVAKMISLMGPPPLEFIHRYENRSKYFDESGKWIGTAEIPNVTLESYEKTLKGENKALFLKFMRKILKWLPEERESAMELLSDPWLNSQELTPMARLGRKIRNLLVH